MSNGDEMPQLMTAGLIAALTRMIGVEEDARPQRFVVDEDA